MPWLMSHGVAALALAAGQLLWLRGLDVRVFLLFGVPPFIAAVAASRGATRVSRALEAAFLIAIGAGGVIAHVPTLFPKLSGGFVGLDPSQDRLLGWYTGIYLLYLTALLPAFGLVGQLRAHRLGQPTILSRFTCVLGLITAFPFVLMSPFYLGMLGFWPVV